MNRTIATIFHAPAGKTEPECAVEGARIASATALIRRLHRHVDEVLVVTPPGAAESFARLDVQVLPSDTGAPFSFGQVLRTLAHDHGADGLLYFGSGSAALLSTELLESLVGFAQQPEPGALLNNVYSCDFAAISHATSTLDATPDEALPSSDNGLGFALSDAGIVCRTLRRSLETDFDIDTPTELVLLRASDRGAVELRRCLDALPFKIPQLVALCDRLCDRDAVVYLSGRINPATWAAFELDVACRTTGTIEGRGMRATGDARPRLLQGVLQQDGPIAFFDRLAQTADAAILDTRPLLAVGASLPPASDRFASDLFLHEAIADPAWRAFAEAAAAARIPVLLGGHSLVSGGLRLLAEICWKGRDLARRLHPEPLEGRDSES